MLNTSDRNLCTIEEERDNVFLRNLLGFWADSAGRPVCMDLLLFMPESRDSCEEWTWVSLLWL